MNQPNWLRVQEVFTIAVGLKEADRIAFLRRIAEQDVDLHGEVISLLSAEKIVEILPSDTATEVIFEDDTTLANSTNTNKNKVKRESDNKLIGEILGNRYSIIKLLGAGGMGEIFLAADRNVMNREVVVKMLRDEALKNKDVVRKFRQEVEALARIKDEGIVTILDSGLYDELPFLVLEYVEGEDLSKVVSPYLFSVRDFHNIESLVKKLRESGESHLVYLREKLKPETQKLLIVGTNKNELAESLRDDFNGWLKDWSLYDEATFQNVKLSPQTSRLLVEREKHNRTMPFNRSLIEDVFAFDVVRGNEKLLPRAQTAEIIRQLCIALAHGHRKGIIHRDLKPPNIMLNDSEERGLRVKLIDFGIAKVRESLVAPTTQIALGMGTPAYMSPEQLRGELDLTPACDIYALGLIALEMLTGNRAFEGKSLFEQHKLQELEQIEELSILRAKTSARIEKIIGRALAFLPENRYAVATDFGDELFAALTQNETLNPREPKNAARTEKSNSSKWLVAIVLSTVLLGIVFIGGFVLLTSKRNGETSATNQNVDAPKFSAKRSFDYKLIVQKFFDGKPFQQPFEATGDEIFGDEWRFRLQMQSPQSGNFYLLTEGANGLAILFPHPQTNDGKSFVNANQVVKTNQMSFDKNQGTEKFWIIWSENPVAELEAVTFYVNPTDLGKIKDAEKEKAVREVLTKHGGKENLRETNEQNNPNERMKKLQSASDVLVKLAELRHN